MFAKFNNNKVLFIELENIHHMLFDLTKATTCLFRTHRTEWTLKKDIMVGRIEGTRIGRPATWWHNTIIIMMKTLADLPRRSHDQSLQIVYTSSCCGSGPSWRLLVVVTRTDSFWLWDKSQFFKSVLWEHFAGVLPPPEDHTRMDPIFRSREGNLLL